MVEFRQWIFTAGWHQTLTLLFYPGLGPAEAWTGLSTPGRVYLLRSILSPTVEYRVTVTSLERPPHHHGHPIVFHKNRMLSPCNTVTSPLRSFLLIPVDDRITSPLRSFLLFPVDDRISTVPLNVLALFLCISCVWVSIS